MYRVAALLIALTLGGCSATGAKYTGHIAPKSRYGVLYVYRPSTFVNSGLAPFVFINADKKPKLRNGGYQRYEVPADQRSELTVEASWVVAFDTGDFWQFTSELARMLEDG